MKAKIYILSIILSCIGIISCTDDYNLFTDASDCINIEVTDEVAQATRANYEGFPSTTFEEGDKIGVYAVDNNNSAVSSNVCFTRQADGSWKPVTSLKFNPNCTYYAYFPWSAEVPAFNASGSGIDGKFAEFIGSDTFWEADQSTKENFTKSNLMAAQGVVSGTRTVNFTMQHKRGLAVFAGAANKWYYTDGDGTKYDVTLAFSGNIPYNQGDSQYFLLKPNTETSVGGQTMSVSAGKYRTTTVGEITGTPSYTYSVSTNMGSSWGAYTTTKPSWLTLSTNTIEGEPTEFVVTTTNSTSRTVSKGTGSFRTVAGDAILKAATPVTNVDLSMVNNAGAARAARTTANCYLVHAPGTYKLPLVYGNAIKNGTTNTSAYYNSPNTYTLWHLVNHADAGITNPWLRNNGATPDGAKLIWEDVKGMISSVGVSGDYLTFSVSPDNIAEGNAVIAATMNGTVVWSWHIWVTPQTLSSTTAVATGEHTYYVAPVNVGHVEGFVVANTTIYAGDLCKVRVAANGVTMEFQVAAKDYAYGGTTYYYPCTYYQWGRKEAERPCIGAYDDAGVYAQDPALVAGSYSIGTTLQNPDCHYYNSSIRSPYNANQFYYWDMGYPFSTRKSTATVKSVYDPCPPDFCVPTENLYHYVDQNRGQATWQTTPPGAVWTVNGTPLFFPAVGWRTYNRGNVYKFGEQGYAWSATKNGPEYARFFSSSKDVIYETQDQPANGYPVRPVAEE